MIDATTIEENLAAMAARFLAESYGGTESAIAAIQAELANNDCSSARAGAMHAVEQWKVMSRAAVANPDKFAAIVFDAVK